MSLSPDEIKKIALLARLEIKEQDIPKYTKELSNILDLVAQMDKVNTDNVEPMAHPFEASQCLRPDETEASEFTIHAQNQRDYFQKLAPASSAGLYLVPQVIGDTEDA